MLYSISNDTKQYPLMHTLTAAVQWAPIPKHVDTTRLRGISRGTTHSAPVIRASSPAPHADPQSFTLHRL